MGKKGAEGQTKQSQEPNNLGEEYYPVPLLYGDGDLIDRDLYVLYQGNHVVFQKANAPWQRRDAKKLQEFGVNHLYVRTRSLVEFHDFIDRKVAKILNEREIPIEQKAKVVYAATIHSAEAVFHNPKSMEYARQTVSFVKHCLEYLNNDKNAFFELFRASALNMTEHNHGLHCAAYAIQLAKRLGKKDPKDLLSISIGAMLHDIGKTKIPKKILEKPGALDEDEIREVRKHPQYGFEIVKEFASVVPEMARVIIMQHHEHYEGDGYPKRLKGHQIHLFSRIVRVCDVFDSMTAHRVYKEKASPIDSLRELLQTTKEDDERHLLVNFIEMMKEE